MKFQKGTRRRALEYEKDLVQYWKTNQTFEKSVAQRPADNAYVFYDGPPFITGVPHHGTLLSSVAKDVVPRFWTMQGKRVERVWGWDCHGLPAEVFTEKKLGIQDRRDIGTKVSLEDYINTCRENMVATGSLWEDTIDRIGRWVDFKGAYRTMDKDFMESVWWAFKELYDKGKIYEGEKVLLYCTRDATPISKAEVAMDNSYQDVTDPSVFVKFKLKGKTNDIKLTKDAKVLFVCAANMGRSQAAMSLYNHYTATHNASGAGTEVEVDEYSEAHTVREFEELRSRKENKKFVGRTHTVLLDDYGIDITDNPRRQMTEEMLKDYDLVVNIAERAQTPNWLRGDNVIWWDIEDVNHSGSMDLARSNAKEIERRVKKLIDDGQVVDDEIDPVYLLAWTTTPWTLPANTAVAVNENEDYAQVEVGGESLILAKALLDKVLTDEKHQVLPYEINSIFKGKELVGLSYEQLFEDRNTADNQNAHKVWHADYVSMEDGSGIVHLAPAYGEEDYALSKEKGFPFVVNIDDNGFFKDSEWKGQNVWEANKPIAKALKERGVVWKIDYITHPYPHCHRCGTKLMYRAHPSWFMDIMGEKAKMLEENENINWFPEHLKHGRFQKTVESAPDWNLSRDRFWATAMPVWKGVDAQGSDRDDNGREYIKVVGSYAELKELSGEELADYHRPWIDDVEFDLDDVHYKRIDKVLDCWFESGSMPFAQFHYPFENKQKFEDNFPGDFIVEYVGQVRAWFYYVHAVNTALFGHNAYKNVITTGTLAGNDGRKMSKSFGNYTDPNLLMDTYSADSLRFLLMSSPLMNAEDFALQDKDVADVARKLSMVWNMYDFFTLYAEVDGWDSLPEDGGLYDDPLVGQDGVPALSNPLDVWIVSRVHQLTAEIAENMERYDVPNATKPILPFLDDASNWYVRRSRRRFWKSDDDGDKNDAYRTLHYVLVRLAHIMAPFTPFLAEELYHKLTGGESVHLRDWPETGTVDLKALNSMTFVREVINDGLSQRAAAKLKVRQPLAAVSIVIRSELEGNELLHTNELLEIIKDELNVKTVTTAMHPHTTAIKEQSFLDVWEGRDDQPPRVLLDLTLTPELRREGQMREVVRQVQNARKQAGLNVDDRIALELDTHDTELKQAIEEHANTIKTETLAATLATDGAAIAEGYTAEVKIDAASLAIALLKV